MPEDNKPLEPEEHDVAERAVIVGTQRKNPLRIWLALGAIAIALGFVLFNGLGEATMFFRPVDKAVDQRAQLGTKRFTIQGLVVEGSVTRQNKSVAFQIENNGVTVPVVHSGIPPELFRENLPVVLDGRFSSATGDASFVSDRMMVKHGSDYVTDNPDRVKDYTETNTAETGTAETGTAETGTAETNTKES
jgi:cytochrome c-type biogenesis protein CcmE